MKHKSKDNENTETEVPDLSFTPAPSTAPSVANDCAPSRLFAILIKKSYHGLDRSLFWQTLVSWECLCGEYCILPVDSAGKVTALGRRVPPIAGLVPLNPDHFAHIVNGHEPSNERAEHGGRLLPRPDSVVVWNTGF